MYIYIFVLLNSYAILMKFHINEKIKTTSICKIWTSVTAFPDTGVSQTPFFLFQFVAGPLNGRVAEPLRQTVSLTFFFFLRN